MALCAALPSAAGGQLTIELASDTRVEQRGREQLQHEQLHWFLVERGAAADSAMAELRDALRRVLRDHGLVVQYDESSPDKPARNSGRRG
jgi:hypothetical protein